MLCQISQLLVNVSRKEKVERIAHPNAVEDHPAAFLPEITVVRHEDQEVMMGKAKAEKENVPVLVLAIANAYPGATSEATEHLKAREKLI